MVDEGARLHGWAELVYRFGCAFIHLSNLHDHQARDPFRGLPVDEREEIVRYLRQYHSEQVSAESEFSEIIEYLPKVLSKISSKLETELGRLEV